MCFLPFGEGGEAIEGEVTLLFDSSDGWRGVEADCWLNWQINRPIIKCWSSLLIFTTCKKETMLVLEPQTYWVTLLNVPLRVENTAVVAS